MKEHETTQLTEQQIKQKCAELLELAKSGNSGRIKAFLDGLSDENIRKQIINFRDDSGKTALHLAAVYGHAEIAKLLLENGADINTKNNEGDTALHWSLLDGKTEIAKLLIKNGADINITNNFNYTALHSAALGGNREIVELLLENGVDAFVKNKNNKTALDLAERYESFEIFKILEEYMAIPLPDVKVAERKGEKGGETTASAAETGQPSSSSHTSSVGGTPSSSFVNSINTTSKQIG